MRRKVIVSASLIAAMTLGLFACGQQANGGTANSAVASSQAAPTVEFETLGDIFSSDATDFRSVYNETHYICAFSLNDIFYKVSAELPEGMFDSLSAVDPDKETDAQDLLAPLVVTHQEVIAEGTPPQQELDALNGKTGADLVAEGYTIESLAINGSETICNATKGVFSYLITFAGAVADENTTDYAGAVHDMAVTSVWFAGVSPHILV